MKKMKKCIAVLLASAITFSNFSGIGSVKEVKAATNVEVKNYSFENTTSSGGKLIAQNWSNNSAAEVVSSGAQSGSKCLKITNSSRTVNEVTQTLQLEPNTEYVLNGYIKGENISAKNEKGEDFGDGATIDFVEETAYMVDHVNNWKQGTFGWTKVTVYFITTSKGTATLRCRLGHGFGVTSGTAYFDNISIQKSAYPNKNRVKIENKNVRGYITKDIVNNIGMDKYTEWLERMQEAYERYADLTGSRPYNGDILNIINTEEPMIQQYGAIGNYNPILHNFAQGENFARFATNGWVNFGDLHEMGHEFDHKADAGSDYAWNFNGDFWANTKMLYVLDHTNDINVNMGGIVVTNSQEAAKYYKEIAKGGYDNSIAQGRFTDDDYDALTYIFIKIIQKIGWEPFKATFRQYVNGNVPETMTTFGKFNQFLNVLQQNCNPNGTEVMDCIGEKDFNIVRAGMKGGDTGYFDDYISYTSMIEGTSNYQSLVSGGKLSGTEGMGKKIIKLYIRSPKGNGILYRAYIDGKWTDWKSQGDIINGNKQDIQALQIKLPDGLARTCDVYYRTHNRYYGWLGWTSNGRTAGTRNVDSAIEGFQIQIVEKGVKVDGVTNDTRESSKEKCRVVFKDYNGKKLKTEVVEYGASATAPSNPTRTGYTFTGWSGSYTNVKDDVEVTAQYTSCLSYSVVIRGNSSFEKYVSEGELAGTEGKDKKIAKLCIKTGNTTGILYRAYIDGKWTDWKSQGSVIDGGQQNIQALQIKLSGTLATKYNVYYRTHNSYYGWLGWTSNGKTAGTRNVNKAIEGFEIRLVEKGTTVDGVTNDTKESCKEKCRVIFKDYNGNVLKTETVEYGASATAPSIPSRTGYTFTGWSGSYTNVKDDVEVTAQYTSCLSYSVVIRGNSSFEKYVSEGELAGTEGKDKKIAKLCIKTGNTTGILYRAYIDGKWTDWKSQGSVIDGEQWNIQALQIKLSGTLATKYNVYYRTHNSYYGWLGWTSNGKTAGTRNVNKAIEGFEIRLVEKGTTVDGITNDTKESSKEKCRVVFKDYNGKTLKTETMEYGASATPPSTPTRTGYTFTGWSGSYKNVKSDIEVTAQYTSCLSYSVVIRGNSSFEKYVSEGELAGTEGKDKKIAKLCIKTGNTTGVSYRAYIDGKWTDWKSQGNIINGNGQNIQALQIKLSGTLATKYNVYYRTHNSYYGWLGWTSDGKTAGSRNAGGAIEGFEIRLVEKGTTVDGVTNDTKESSKEKSRVVFKDYNGKVLKTETVEYGASATAPSNPTRTGYTFTGWSGSYKNVKDDVEVTAQYEKEQHITTIYYKGYDNPYIHYKIGNGSWTNVPGIKMEANTEVAGYNYAITIDLNNATSLTACFNDGNNKWDSNNGKNYTFGVGYYTYSNNKITKIAKPEKKLKITKFYATPEGSCVSGKEVILKTETQDAQGTVQYKYVATYPDGTTHVLRNYTTYKDLSWMLGTVGKYKITVYVTDGVTTAEKTLDYEVKELKNITISKLESSLGTEFTVGQTTTISMESQEGFSPYYYSIKVNGVEILPNTDATSASWTPTQTGSYLVEATASDARGGRDKKTMTIDVVETNKTTIYYKGYEKPYIHYRVGNGSWTQVPGVKMEANTEVAGYNYAITIDLNNATSLTACFNDGNNNWDSNNGKNYTFGAGYYTYSNNRITKIAKPEKKLKITKFYATPEGSCVSGKQVIFKTETQNAQGTVQYKYAATYPDGTTHVLRNYTTYKDISWMPGTIGKYKITVSVTDGVSTAEQTLDYEVKELKDITISKLESSLGTEFTVGQTTTISMESQEGFSPYYYSIRVNGVEILPNTDATSASWTPIKAGRYTVVATARDSRSGRDEKTMTINVAETNLTTIYYRGYENPYIHYRVGNGTWTNVPGVRMEANSDVAGYNYAITIDLGSQTNVTACFNDGYGNWDSNNGKNYTFGVGYYTCSNGTICKIDKPSSELKVKSVISSAGDTIKYGSSTDITINAGGGEGAYTYTMYYTAYGSGRTCYLLQNSKNNTATFQPDYPQTKELYIIVRDEAGHEAKYEKQLEVKEMASNQVTIYYSGYTNPNIHYRVGNGNWTSVPGVRMESSSKMSGYPYAITIDLGDETGLTACFNDGNNNWDSANGNNYTFGVGEYTYSNGRITKIK